jgi:hypothetical protein
VCTPKVPVQAFFTRSGDGIGPSAPPRDPLIRSAATARGRPIEARSTRSCSCCAPACSGTRSTPRESALWALLTDAFRNGLRRRVRELLAPWPARLRRPFGPRLGRRCRPTGGWARLHSAAMRPAPIPPTGQNGGKALDPLRGCGRPDRPLRGVRQPTRPKAPRGDARLDPDRASAGNRRAASGPMPPRRLRHPGDACAGSRLRANAARALARGGACG